MKDKKPFAMAGLFDRWKNAEGKTITTCAIVTTEANEFMKPLHHRMPVIIDPKDYDLWLDPAVTDRTRLERLLKPCPSDILSAHEVSSMVNSPMNNSGDCIVPV